MGQENLCYRANTCRQSNVGQNTLGNDNQVTGFADQSDNLQQSATANKTTPTPTPTPTPIPGNCPTGTIFDVTTQVLIGGDFPIGTVLCLNVAGLNLGITAIVPGGQVFVGSNIVVTQPLANGQCPAGSFAVAVTSGVLPSPLSGTTVCVALQT